MMKFWKLNFTSLHIQWLSLHQLTVWLLRHKYIWQFWQIYLASLTFNFLAIWTNTFFFYFDMNRSPPLLQHRWDLSFWNKIPRHFPRQSQYISFRNVTDTLCVRACYQRFEWDVTGVKVWPSGSIYSFTCILLLGRKQKVEMVLVVVGTLCTRGKVHHYCPLWAVQTNKATLGWIALIHSNGWLIVFALNQYLDFSAELSFWFFTKFFWGGFARIM